MSLPSYAHPAAPPAHSLGPEAAWAARCAGFTLFDWQAAVLDAAMATVGPADDRLAHPQVTLICPRRNGKTQLVMARILAGALAWDEASILYTAHLGDTARHMFATFLELLHASPWLASQVAGVKYGKGDEGVTFKSGATFSIRARTASGGRGMECSTLILDEALELKDDHISALTPLLAKADARGQGQLWMVSSAGHGRSDVLQRARDRGRAAAAGTADPELAYFEWCADRDADPSDPAVWTAANPSLGTSILSASFLASQYRSMSLEEYGREHLGWWTHEVAAPFLPHWAWDANTQHTAPTLPDRPRIVFGVELQDYGARAVLVAGVDLGDGRYWVETLDRWHDTRGLDPEQLAAAIVPHVRAHRPTDIVGDDFTCTALFDQLKARRMPVTRLNQTHIRAASQALLSAATLGRIPHPPDTIMAAELGNAGQASAGDGLSRLSRKNSSGPSTAAFAVAAAVWMLTTPGARRPVIVTRKTA